MNQTTWNMALRYLQWIGLSIIAVGLPFSNFLMSLGMLWLAVVLFCMIATDLLTGKSIHPRWHRYTSNSNALALSALFALPLIGLLWTSDFNYAAWDLRMKLPILALPLLLSMLEPLTQGQFRALMGLFILAVISAVMWCLQVYWTSGPEIENDVRKISVFISHVRFSLLIALALGLLVRFANGSRQGRLLITLVAVPSLYFIYVIGSVTGIMVILVLAIWMGIRFLLLSKNNWLKFGIAASMIATMAFSSMTMSIAYQHYFDAEPLVWNTLETTTLRGEKYEHHVNYPLVEDGHFVMTYIAWGELYGAWYTRSLMHPDSMDARGHALKGTLIRYLASKGLRKDADGIAALSSEDIEAIEMGVPTIHDGKKRGLEKRLDRIFFEWSNYRAGGDPNGHSVLQRWEFWKTAASIIAAHPWIGVGTGDVKTSFNQAYIDNHSPLQQEFRLRAHNQYLTMWMSYGIGGLIIFLVVLCWPIFQGYRHDVIVVMFLLLAWLSCITEDTLESQAGVMFFAFFYSLFTSRRALSLAELGRGKSKVARPSSDAKPRK